MSTPLGQTQRGRGVQNAQTPVEDDADNTTTPLRLIAVADIEQKYVKYSDKNGRVHDGVILIIGGKPYMAPQSEVYLSQVQELAPWMTQALEQRVADRKRTQAAHGAEQVSLSDVEVLDDPTTR